MVAGGRSQVRISPGVSAPGAMMARGEMLAKVAERLQQIETSSKEQIDEAEAVRDARYDSKAEKVTEALDSQAKSWQSMRERIDHFEQMLQEDKQVAAAGGPTIVETGGPEQCVAGGPMTDVDAGGSAGGPAVSLKIPASLAKEGAEMSVLIKRLQKQAQTAQEIYVLSLDDYREVDAETWATHFPVGYRERIAPVLLEELYATGKNLKNWAKDWLKDKQLGDCQEARDIIGACSALDALFLTDKVPGAINQVTTERLARKVMGIRSAFKDVMKEGDWKKTASAAKTWKSKIDRETWRRTDPQLEDVEHMFVHRKAEDEMRAEMDRDASLLKAKAKLAERVAQ